MELQEVMELQVVIREYHQDTEATAVMLKSYWVGSKQ